MAESLQSKAVIVVGGSSGLGFAISKAFATSGCRVLISGRDGDRLALAKQKVPAVGTAIADIRDQDQVDRLVQEAIDELGQIDILVNCAGMSTRKAIKETTPEDFRELLDVNFLGTVRCTLATLPHLLETKGHIVNVGSLASKIGTPFLGAYPASKFPVAAYSQQLRLELASSGLHVLLVCPGPLKRDDAGNRYDSDTDGLPEAARLPGGGSTLRLVDPNRLANRIVWACEHRKKELVVPARARMLFAISQLFPAWGDWILQRSLKG